MSRRYNIRWSESDEKELARVVRNFNAKIDRMAKKDPKNKTALPEKVKVKQFKQMIDTRQDLNRELNSLKRFSRRGAEEIIPVPNNDYNLKITKWQKEEMTRRTAVINRKRKEVSGHLKNIEMKSGGERLGYTVGQFGMGKAEEVSLSPLETFTKKMNAEELKRKYRHIIKESQISFYDWKAIRLKENYLKGLRQNYNENDIADVIEAIEKMPFNKFYNTWNAEGGTMEWASIKPSENEMQGYVERLRSQWVPKK